jgi:hypothetical protein
VEVAAGPRNSVRGLKGLILRTDADYWDVLILFVGAIKQQ